MKPQMRCSFHSTAPATDPIADRPNARVRACFWASVQGAGRGRDGGIGIGSEGLGSGGAVGPVGAGGPGGVDAFGAASDRGRIGGGGAVLDVPLVPTKETYSPRPMA